MTKRAPNDAKKLMLDLRRDAKDCLALRAAVMEERSFQFECHPDSLSQGIWEMAKAALAQPIARTKIGFKEQMLLLQAVGEALLRWMEFVRALPPIYKEDGMVNEKRTRYGLVLWMTPDPDVLIAQMQTSVDRLNTMRSQRLHANADTAVVEYIDEWIAYITAWMLRSNV